MVKSTRLFHSANFLSLLVNSTAPANKKIKAFVSSLCCLVGLLLSTSVFAQTFPPATSCTSNDLQLVEAILPPNQGENACTCGGERTLKLSINNKTGSTRTSFAFWGTLIIYNPDGTEKSRTPISDCFSNITSNIISIRDYKDKIKFECGESLEIIDLFLAWTDANKKSVCPLNSANIAPKCGILPKITVVAGIDAAIEDIDATCSQGGSITVSPFGGVVPYSITVNGETKTVAKVGESASFTGLAANTYPILISDSRTPTPCSTTKSRTILQTQAPTAPTSGGNQNVCSDGTTTQTLTASATAPSGSSVVWYTAATDGTGSETAPTQVGVGTKTVYAASRSTTTSCESSTRTAVTLTIKEKPGAPTVDVVNNCDGSSDLTAGNYTGSLLWSNVSTNASIHVTNAATYTVSQTVDGCTSNTGSGTSAPKNAPGAPVLNKTDNCDGTTTITAKDGDGNAIAANELTWSNSALSGNPVTVTTTEAVTATRTVNGCTSISSNSLTPAPKTTHGAPVLSVVNNCDATSTITAKDGSDNLIAADELTWSNGESGNPITVSVTTAVTATRTVNGCSSSSSNLVTPAPKNNPAAPILSKVDNCDGTTTITAKDGNSNVIDAAELTWSNDGNGNPITVSTTTAITAIRTVNGCTSINSNSITPAPKTKPGTPTVNVVNNCDGSSDLTAGNYMGTLLWSNGSVSVSIHVTNAATYTVTQTVNGCTSDAGSGTSAPKFNPAAPVLLITQPSLCGPTTGSLEVCGPVAGYKYKIGSTEITAQSGQPVKFDNLAPGSNPSIKVISTNGCEASTPCSSALLTCPEEGIRAVTSTGEQLNASNSKISDITARIVGKAHVLAAPNPFTDKVRFTLQSDVSGQGSLEIYNTVGQRIATVYQGYVEAGQTLVKEYNVSRSHRQSLVYVFRVGDQKTTGKLLNW